MLLDTEALSRRQHLSGFHDELPRRLIGDKGYDADPLDVALEQLGALDDCAPSPQSYETQDTGRPFTSAVLEEVENRETLRLVGKLSPFGCPL